MTADPSSPNTPIDVEATTVLAGGDPALASAQRVSLPAALSERRTIPPSLAERYEDIHFLGEGGMGTVYRGRDPRLGRIVALKLLKGTDPNAWARFIQEARSQARIEHEHVCRVYEAGEVDGEPFIAMQYIEGESLSKLAANLSLEQRVKIIGEVSAAVHEAHRLGIIHRDIKPGNIMLERRIDGTLKPYIMDFGLAKEVEEKGKTVTGAVLGTPAYMSPEQAQGDIHTMDRRSDVYSLGATLYSLIAGHPPFVAEHHWKLLLLVAFEDAPPLSKVKKGVPPDLETIVMKCLERDPARRYDSARALAEDLQRYLDGEPILGRRASIGYVLWKKARKHKLATALGGMSLVAALSLGGVWFKARQESAARAKIAQELGERMKESELFLRSAYELPLHDVERERDVVRKKLESIEQRRKEAGRAGEGPIEYALGRGQLALGDMTAARGHLEKAVAAGYSSADLHYALGRTLGELYRKALADTKRITNAEERKKREAELAVELRDPALLHLRAAGGVDIEAPVYVEGLIALYEGKNDEAREKAKAAFEQAPWMYEAKKLEADALYAEGSKYRHDAAFDYEKMKSYFEPAAEAYKIAARMAESDPEVHRAECELWEKMANATSGMGKSPEADFDAADAACLRAVRASSANGESRIQRALTLQYRFFWANSAGKNVDAAQAAALEAVEEAVRMRPQDPMALYARASTFYARVMGQASRGEPLSFKEAVDAFQQVLAVDPQFIWALSELGQTYLTQAQVERLHGKDPRPALTRAQAQFQRASEVDSTFTFPSYLSIRALCIRLGYETDHGVEAEQTISALEKAVNTLDVLKLGGWSSTFWKARALRLRAAYELARGQDPRPHIREALAIIRKLGPAESESGFMLRETVELRLVEAEFALDTKNASTIDLGPERAQMEKEVQQLTDPAVDEPALLGRIELIMLRARRNDPEMREADFDRVLTALGPKLSIIRDDPRGYEVLAELHAEKAAWLELQRKPTHLDTEKGLAFVDRVLAIDPHSANAFRLKGQLLLLKAFASAGDDRKKVAAEALEALGAAIRENPRMENNLTDAMNVAKGMK